MTILALLSAKGGIGSSLIATNLGCALSRIGRTALLDVHPGGGVDHMLLDLIPGHSWDELLPVFNELQPRHLELARLGHESGLELFAAPDRWEVEVSAQQLAGLAQEMNLRFTWLILDLPVGLTPLVEECLPLANMVLFVTTADPISLRATKVLFDQIPPEIKERAGLVINQYTRRHPVKPRRLSDGIGIELVATLPSDVPAIGYQVNFGRACVLDRRSGFGRAISAFADRLNLRLQAMPA